MQRGGKKEGDREARREKAPWADAARYTVGPTSRLRGGPSAPPNECVTSGVTTYAPQEVSSAGPLPLDTRPLPPDLD